MASEGQRFLPISDAMARDLDSGKATGRDLADFLPDEVAQELYDQSNPGPVRAENLRPISKAEAQRRTTFDGESMPKFPATRRVIPAPYKRDRVVGGSHGKQWTTVLAGAVKPGDIITDLGLVVRVEELTAYATRAHVADGTAQDNLMAARGTELPEGYGPDELVAMEPAFAVVGAGGKVVVFRYKAEVSVFRAGGQSHG